MLWMHGKGRGMTCPTCQIPDGYDDDKDGRFLQAWDSGFAGGVLRVQKYEAVDALKIPSRGN